MSDSYLLVTIIVLLTISTTLALAANLTEKTFDLVKYCPFILLFFLLSLLVRFSDQTPFVEL